MIFIYSQPTQGYYTFYPTSPSETVYVNPHQDIFQSSLLPRMEDGGVLIVAHYTSLAVKEVGMLVRLEVNLIVEVMKKILQLPDIGKIFCEN